jgi:glycosyltransferase involved in cell wall biosynthesis
MPTTTTADLPIPTTARRPGQPLLTIAIPTFNRELYLMELLESLLPQLAGLATDLVELIVSDNCSEDLTASMVVSFQDRGLPCRLIRNETNLGADGNFLQCLNLAQGQYVWVLGDDDLVEPGAIATLLDLLQQGEYDLVYLSSYAFHNNRGGGPIEDKLGRVAEIVTDGVYFLEKVNALIGLISVNIVNKNRLLATPHPPIEQLNDTNLLQVGWLFPLIHRRMSVLFLWRRLVGYRSYNSGGWGICEVFGIRLERIARQYFASEPILARGLMNGVLRYWLCDAILEMRRGRHAHMNEENFAHDIRHLFHGNWIYWVFVYPMAELPLPVAEAVHRGLALVNQLTRIAQGLTRHIFRRGQYLTPR